jgi:hypothetical protein
VKKLAKQDKKIEAADTLVLCQPPPARVLTRPGLPPADCTHKSWVFPKF